MHVNGIEHNRIQFNRIDNSNSLYFYGLWFCYCCGLIRFKLLQVCALGGLLIDSTLIRLALFIHTLMQRYL